MTTEPGPLDTPAREHEGRSPGDDDAGHDLRLEGVTKRFGSFIAVKNLDLVVPRGSFFGLLGASGCGKTTTLRMIAGLEQPSSGRIMIGGIDVAGVKAYKRPVNTVFQSYALFPHLSIADNVAFGLRRRGVKDVSRQVTDMLALVELESHAKKKPAQLSGGQQQRVALARALINKPEVLLLDEPLGALDLRLRRQMQIELKRIQSEVGLTFVHVTHDQEEAMTMADTIAVMNKGVIEQLGTPAELYENPRTTFVANFLGQSNLLEAEARTLDCYIPPPRPVVDSLSENMREKLRSEAGADLYRRRKTVVEPVFGQIKQARGFRQVSFRGLEAVRQEWLLICLTHNLLKLFRAGVTPKPAPEGKASRNTRATSPLPRYFAPVSAWISHLGHCCSEALVAVPGRVDCPTGS